MTHPRHLVDTADQAIRTANHATLEPGHLTVQDTCVTVAELVYLTRALDQLCRQLDHNLHQRVDANDLRHDAWGDPNDTTINAATALRLAARQFNSAAELLNGAWEHLGHIADLAPLVHDPDQEEQS